MSLRVVPNGPIDTPKPDPPGPLGPGDPGTPTAGLRKYRCCCQESFGCTHCANCLESSPEWMTHTVSGFPEGVRWYKLHQFGYYVVGDLSSLNDVPRRAVQPSGCNWHADFSGPEVSLKRVVGDVVTTLWTGSNAFSHQFSAGYVLAPNPCEFRYAFRPVPDTYAFWLQTVPAWNEPQQMIGSWECEEESIFGTTISSSLFGPPFGEFEEHHVTHTTQSSAVCCGCNMCGILRCTPNYADVSLEGLPSGYRYYGANNTSNTTMWGGDISGLNLQTFRCPNNAIYFLAEDPDCKWQRDDVPGPSFDFLWRTFLPIPPPICSSGIWAIGPTAGTTTQPFVLDPLACDVGGSGFIFKDHFQLIEGSFECGQTAVMTFRLWSTSNPQLPDEYHEITATCVMSEEGCSPCDQGFCLQPPAVVPTSLPAYYTNCVDFEPSTAYGVTLKLNSWDTSFSNVIQAWFELKPDWELPDTPPIVRMKFIYSPFNQLASYVFENSRLPVDPQPGDTFGMRRLSSTSFEPIVNGVPYLTPIETGVPFDNCSGVVIDNQNANYIDISTLMIQ